MTAEEPPAPPASASASYRRRNRRLVQFGLCAAGGLLVGGLLAVPFSGDDAAAPAPTAAVSSVMGSTVVGSTVVGSTVLGSSATVSTAARSTATVSTVGSVPTTLPATTVVTIASPTIASTTTVDPPITTSAPPTAVPTDLPTIPGVDAPAYVVMDADTGEVLAGSNAEEQRAVGSLMKLLTAYVVMRAGDPDKVVTIPKLDVIKDESIIGLVPGMQYDRALLLRALLVVSAGDAAQALAVDVGGDEAAFVEQMNQAARSLGLTDTVAANETGLDADGAHSSATDMAELAHVLMQDPTFRETVDNQSAKLFGKTVAATNRPFLTGYPGATGVKTGHTTQAGYSLAASATRDGRNLIAVVLGTPSAAARTAQAEAALDWGFAQAA